MESLDKLLEQSLPVYWTHNGYVWTNLPIDSLFNSFPSIREWTCKSYEFGYRMFLNSSSPEYLKKEFEKIGVENAYITIFSIHSGFPDRIILERVFNVRPLTTIIDQPGGAINIKESKFFSALFETANKDNASIFIENVAYATDPNYPNQILAVKIRD